MNSKAHTPAKWCSCPVSTLILLIQSMPHFMQRGANNPFDMLTRAGCHSNVSRTAPSTESIISYIKSTIVETKSNLTDNALHCHFQSIIVPISNQERIIDTDLTALNSFQQFNARTLYLPQRGFCFSKS